MAASASSIRSIFRSTSFRHRCTSSKITADGKTYDATNGLRLPPRIRNLAIDYTALSFVAPEKVRFRYKLEGQNRELAGGRQRSPGAVYEPRSGHLPLPRDGEQQQRRLERNRRDARISRSRPAYYQTRWFAAMVALGISRCCGRRINCGSGNSRGSSTGRWTRASASGRASRATCTTRCCRVSRACCCGSTPR